MPFPGKYRSTGRPPGKFHIRHSLKEITENLESPSPPFDIFSIDFNNNNNNNNYICYCNNGTTTATPATTAPATINYKTSAEGISTEDGEDAEAPGLSEWSTDRTESMQMQMQLQVQVQHRWQFDYYFYYYI